MKQIIILSLISLSILTCCTSSKYRELGDGLFADINTTKGDIILRLEMDKTPVTVANFVSLAEGSNPFVSEEYKDKKYYNGVIFHRVIKDFMIQGGDPTGTGRGNPGYRFKDEFNDSLIHDKAGILSMANSGPKTNGSQFFITHKETPFLNGRHTVFGEVVVGLDVVDSIANVNTDTDPNKKDKPIIDVVMNSVIIVRNGKEAKNFDAAKVMSDYFAEEEAVIAKMEELISGFATEINDQKESTEAMSSGLKILKLKEGTGVKPAIGDKVLVKYAGWLNDGNLFDSNYEDIAVKFGKYDEKRKQGGGYEPFPMDYSPESRLVAGFKEGLLTMKVGDKIRLFIPPHLGYGSQGGGPIPPDADLVFDVEILGIAE